jgi:formylglycine-generating enzyme required for sulfatase activity
MSEHACHARPSARTGTFVPRRRGGLASIAATLLLAGAAHVAPARAASPPAPFRDCPDCPEMVRVPAGTFTMGTSTADADDSATRAESQATIVRIARPFAIGRMEVTRRQFAAFVADTEYESKTNCRTWNDELARYADDRTRSWQNPGRPREPGDDHPVSCVSWTDAKAYVQWLARKTRKPYRLPSEAEWEYAARAGSTKARAWGESAADGCTYANVFDATSRQQYPFGWAVAACDDRYADVAPVGSLRPNAFGLHDTIGNVAEWVEDCATDSYVGRPRDEKPWVWIGGCERRIQRGGGWLTPPERARSAFRADGPVEERTDYLGFRVALDLDARAEGR